MTAANTPSRSSSPNKAWPICAANAPADRAKAIIENCAHPDYRALLRDYVALAGDSHSPQTLRAAFAMHLAFAETGDMRAVHWSTPTAS